MKKLRLSTYISMTVTFLVIISTLIISGILYYNLSKTLTSEFEDRVKAEYGESFQMLTSQFHRSDNRLKELCQDNTIRVTLMLGATQQLKEYLSKQYGTGKDTCFFIRPLDSDEIYRTSSMDLPSGKIKAFLASPEEGGRLEKMEELGFVYSRSYPVFRQKEQIGVAASLFILKNNETVREFISKNNTGALIKIEGKKAWNLVSGQPVGDFTVLLEDIKSEGLSYVLLNGEKTAVVKKSGFTDLVYISRLYKLTKAKKRIFALVFYSSLFVLLLTLIISFFLANMLGKPLSELSKKSLEMAEGKSDLAEITIPSNVIEIQQLMYSLSAMVKNLRQTEELKRYQQLFEGVSDPVFICGFFSNFIDVNEIAVDQFGFAFKEFIGMRLMDIVPHKHHGKIVNIIKALSQRGGRVVFETEILKKNMELVYVECHAKKIVFKEEEVILSVVRDITDRKKAEAALKRSEERLSLAMEVSLSAAWELDIPTERFAIDTKQFEAVLGYSETEYPEDFSDIQKNINPVALNKNREKRLTEFLQGKTTDYVNEFVVTTKKGERKWIHNRARVVKWDKEQKAKQIIGTAIDISELKRAEQALRDNEERYRSILDNRNIGYFEVDLNGDIIFFNDSLAALTGYSPDELMGLNYKVYTDEKTSAVMKKKYTKIFRTGVPIEAFEYCIKRKDGVLRMFETSVSLIRDTKYRPVGFRGLVIDVTERKTAEQERKKLETELRQSHKMEAIGTLAGGIAHDFNNILSGIFGYSQLTEQNIDNPVKARAYISQIMKAARRAAELVRQILTFSRQSTHEKHLLKVSIVVKEALKLLRSSIPSTIEIRENVFSDATVLADPTQVHQVIMNLCTNAYHAMRMTGGVLTVELEEVEVHAAESVTEAGILPGKYLVLEVRDTAQGMDGELMGKIFDPYFTTKEIGEGTGLGLSLVYGIVEEHGGYIKVHSEVGKGSVFRVFLPISDDKSREKEEELTLEPLTGGTEKVMVVDDEESILISTRELLEDYGYQVSDFSNALLAFKEFKKNPDQFDLVITDMTMPKMTGDELSIELLKLRPDLPVIICTGYSEKITRKKALALGIREYVQKPVDTEKFIQLIRNILDEM